MLSKAEPAGVLEDGLAGSGQVLAQTDAGLRLNF